MALLKTVFIMITSLITGIFADKSEVAKKPDNATIAKQSLYDFKVKSLQIFEENKDYLSRFTRPQ